MKHPAHKRASLVFQISTLLVLVSFMFSTHPVAATFKDESTFVDPTATLECKETTHKPCKFGSKVYIGPFANLRTPAGRSTDPPSIDIGNDSNVQDNTLLDATNNRPITLGENVIIAHGAHVFGGARIGVDGSCEKGGSVCASFVGFNSDIAEGAVVERDAMVMHLARVGPNVTIPSGKVVRPGMNVTDNLQIPHKTRDINDLDRKFMADVIKVNVDLADGYIKLQQDRESDVHGINFNPSTDLNPTKYLPLVDGTRTSKPENPNRVIGNVTIAGSSIPTVRMNVAVRADEGTPFELGAGVTLENSTTFHALEHTKLVLGTGGHYLSGSIVHGGPSNNATTSVGNNFVLGTNSVFFDSTAGDNCKVSEMSLVMGVNLPANTTVRANRVVSPEGESIVEWTRPSGKRGNNKKGTR